MVQWVKVPAPKPQDLSATPGAPIVEGEPTPAGCPLQVHMHTQIKRLINAIRNQVSAFLIITVLEKTDYGKIILMGYFPERRMLYMTQSYNRISNERHHSQRST